MLILTLNAGLLSLLLLLFFQDCMSTGIHGNEFSIVNVTMSDMGNYTCLVIFRYEEQNYTASHTFQLRVNKKGE